MAVERMLARIGLAADPGPAGELLHRLAHLLAGGVERRHRSARPHEHPHVDALGRLGQQLRRARRGVLAADELEVAARRAIR